MANELFSRVESTAIKVFPSGVTLNQKKARYIILTNQNLDENGLIEVDTDGNGYKSSPNIVLWGYHSTYAHVLAPSETSILIPVIDASDISLRTLTATERLVWYSLIF